MDQNGWFPANAGNARSKCSVRGGYRGYLLPPVCGSSIVELDQAAAIHPATGATWSSGDMEFLMQPTNRTLLEEVNENIARMEPLDYPVTTPPVCKLPARTASSADGQVCTEGVGRETGSADKGQASEQSIEQVDPKTPGWTQRVRVGAAALGRAP